MMQVTLPLSPDDPANPTVLELLVVVKDMVYN